MSWSESIRRVMGRRKVLSWDKEPCPEGKELGIPPWRFIFNQVQRKPPRNTARRVVWVLK